MVTSTDILNAKILVVDDKEANIRLIEGMLRIAGYTSVHSTTNPLEVCELHRINRYGLILLDLQMPAMDGFEVMEGLKETETGGFLHYKSKEPEVRQFLQHVLSSLDQLSLSSAARTQVEIDAKTVEVQMTSPHP